MSDPSVMLSEWRRPDSQDTAPGAIPVEDEGEASPPGACNDLVPDEEHFHEATGNEGASFERTCRPAALTCRRPRCGELARFLADPGRKAWALKAAQADRRHVEDTVTTARCDVHTATGRHGRPCSLVCTENLARLAGWRAAERLSAREAHASGQPRTPAAQAAGQQPLFPSVEAATGIGFKTGAVRMQSAGSATSRPVSTPTVPLVAKGLLGRG